MVCLVVCPACNRVVEKQDADEAIETRESHNEERHGGDDMATVFPSEEVPPEGVNLLYDRLREESREQRERFARTVMEDDRLRTSSEDSDPSREELLDLVVALGSGGA